MRTRGCPSPLGESPQLRRVREHKEKDGRRRDRLAAFFFDLAKLVFAALAIGGITPLISGYGNVNWVVAMVGVAVTFLLAFVGNRILK